MPRAIRADAPPVSRPALPSKNIDVSALLQEGVVVTLSIGRWRAMQKLQIEDLGLDGVDREFVQQFLSLGKKTLIPPVVQRKLNAIESSARSALRRYSFDTPFGFFVPAAAYPKLEEEIEKRRVEWMAMRDELIKNLASYEKEVYKAYRDFAKELQTVIEFDDEFPRESPREYAKGVIALVPKKAEIRNSFRFEFEPFKIPMPTVIDKRLRQNLLSDERTRRKLEMEERINAKYEREREQKVEQFFNSVNLQLREMVFEVANNAIGSIDRNDMVLVGKSAAQLKNLIQRYRTMNFLGDTEIDAQLDRLDGYLKAKADTKEAVKDVRGILSQMAAMSKTTLIDLGVPQREVRRMELDAKIDDVAIARRVRRAES